MKTGLEKSSSFSDASASAPLKAKRFKHWTKNWLSERRIKSMEDERDLALTSLSLQLKWGEESGEGAFVGPDELAA